MSHHKPYSSYKETSVDWLGSVPEHWDLKPLFSVYRKTKRTGFSEEELLSVYRDYGVIKKSSRDDNNNRPSDDLSSYQLVEPSDLVTNKMKTWQGSIAVSALRGIVSPAYFVYSAEHKANDRYIHHLLRCGRYISGYLSSSKGIRVNQWDLDQDLFRRFPVLLPPSKEQQGIAAFLDRETARIDGLIEKKQRQTELLKEKRQAIITQTVTKGLDLDVPMKDSGVEWLGEVPGHWVVKKLKHLILPKKGAIKVGPFGSDLTSSEMVGGEVKVYNQKTVINNDFRYGDNYITAEKFKKLSSFEIFTGDILMTTRGTIGKTALVPQRIQKGILHPCLMRIQIDTSEIEPEYLQFFVEYSSLTTEQLKLLSNATTIEVIYSETLKNIYVMVPPIGEQSTTLKKLGAMLNKLDALSTATSRSIELLKERRSALITAAVTGQIDVRGE